MPNPIINRRVVMSAPASALVATSAASQAFLDELNTRGLTPDSDRWTLYDTLLTGLSDDGVFAKLDRAKMFAAVDEATADVDLVAPSVANDLTKVNTLAFTADRGYAGNASRTGYINLNFVGNDLTNWESSTPSGAFGTYTRQWVPGNTVSSIGRVNASGNGSRLNPARSSFDQMQGAIMSSSVDSTSVHGTLGLGLHTLSRNGSTEKAWDNGSETGGFSVSGNVFDGAGDWYALCYSQNGTATQVVGNAAEVSFYFIGGDLTAGNQSDLFTRVEAYLDGVGAGVV